MRGKTVIITGANSGIGEAAARELARRGAAVGLVCRSQVKGEAAMARIREVVAGAELSLHLADLASFASIRAAAASIMARHPRIDLLINNAGLYLPERQSTTDGLEATVQINHFGPFLLTQLLLERIVASAPARIINVSSEAHRGGRLRFDDLQSARRYRALEVYGTSKLMNILHVRGLARRLDPSRVTANALHPGVVATGFAQTEKSLFGSVVKLIGPWLSTPEDGARTTLHLATAPEGGQVSGGYFARSRPKKPSRAALDDLLVDRLWSSSVQLTDAPEWTPGG